MIGPERRSPRAVRPDGGTDRIRLMGGLASSRRREYTKWVGHGVVVGVNEVDLGERIMIRAWLVLGSAVAMAAGSAPAMAGGCKGCDKVAKEGAGWCCEKGKVFGMPLASKPLYEALAGRGMKKVYMESRCEGCRTAAMNNGRCEHCKLGGAYRQLYGSPFAHAVALGEPYSADKAAHCGGCKKAHAGNGFCTGCGVGFVAGRMFKEKDGYDTALAALKTIMRAVATSQKCAACAVAMVTDGSCTKCNISYKDGKKTS